MELSINNKKYIDWRDFMCIWNTSADMLDFSSTEIMKCLYINYPVKKFINASNSMGVSACKGMGKTFLLKVKRMKMSNAGEEKENILLLPKNQLVDTPGTILLNKTHIRFLSSYYNWVDLWISCVAIYLLSIPEIKATFSDDEFYELNTNASKLISHEHVGVFSVLGHVLNDKTQKTLRDVIQASNLMFSLLQRIQRPICLFLDKLEEPFNRYFYKIPGTNTVADGRYNASLWAYAQLAFAEAVYRLYSGRHHIKIFYGIRQEALFGCENITRESTKILSMVTKLNYTYSDLREMCRIYIKQESHENLMLPDLAETNPFKALCGIDTVMHRSGKPEHIWAYIYRHSLQRPRDIMEMALALYENTVHAPDLKKNDENALTRICRHWINEISTRQCMDYLTGLEPFMALEENIAFTQNIMNFLKYLPTNVFTSDSILQYCHRCNENTNEIKCGTCENIHFFSTLFNIGLLGYIYKSASEDGYKNYIKPIGDSIYATSTQTLPNAELYYTHPGIGNIIKGERDKAQLQYVASNFIINSNEVFANAREIQRLQHFCTALIGNAEEKRVFLTSTGRDLSETRKRIKRKLEESGYQVFAYEFDSFPEMKPDGIPFSEHHPGETHDHCIDVVLTCKHLIYIFDGRFGGPYHGKKYQQYIDENSNIIKITPSISFVEYLVAKTFGKNTKVYVSEKVDLLRGEWLVSGAPDVIKSNVVDSSKVYKQLGYFNALGNGTWYDKYPDSCVLEEFISKHFPPI